MKKLAETLFVPSLLFMLFYSSPMWAQQSSFTIDYEKYILDNGLEVILHKDTSDPIVAVATLVHVGSNREKPGRTGFAHFFEHMSFNDSENAPRGANRKMIPELGGSRNGGTWSDGTIYYEVVPTDAFEKILWIDSDRLGFMINTVTEEALEREKQVVKNEKRQRVDNAPYGFTDEIKRAALYPPDHPYHWTVIGSLPDLQAATLDDVKEFYDQYYGANNATLVIAGDIDMAKTRELVDYWFGEIRRGPEVEPMSPQSVSLEKSRSLYFEDNFAKLPELRMVFPTVEEYHPDSYALQVLAEILSGSKKAELYKIIVEEKKLAPSVSTYNSGMELAGEFTFRVRANAGTDLDEVKAAIKEGLQRFEQTGVPESELRRVKAQIETMLYRGIETVLDKAFQLAIYNEYAGDPGYITIEAERLNAVTAEDVMTAYEKYIKDKPYVLTSVVPKGQLDLAINDAEQAEVWQEEFTEGGEHEEVSQGEEAVYDKTSTKNNRSEPPLGETPMLRAPEVWTTNLQNGIRVYGIEHKEVPLVTFDVTLKGGHWLDPLNKAGVSSLLADLMMEGTKTRTPAELEEAIGLLGASISISAGDEEMRISASTLAKNFQQTVDLVAEILLEPRWDENEFDRLKRELATQLKDRESNPAYVSAVAYRQLLYGDQHILGLPISGTPETTADISLDDLKSYYDKNVSPKVATIHVVGSANQALVETAFENLAASWSGSAVNFPTYALPKTELQNKLYFIDVPDAKQSVIRAGRLVLSAKDNDYNNLNYAIQVLGGGSSGRMFQLLRIEKGYTYGAYSFLDDTIEKASLTSYTSVRSNVTLESMQLMRELFVKYQETFGELEMQVTKNQIIKGNTRAFESLGAKQRLLQNMSKFERPANFVELNQKELLEMSLDDFHQLISTHVDEQNMVYLVVGDAATQFDQLASFNGDKPVMLDIYGRLHN